MISRNCQSRRVQRWARHLCASLLIAAAGVTGGGGGLAEAARYAAMAIDANTGQVLHAEAADEARYPASLTKMMTIYLVFERIEQGRLRPDTRIRISENAASTSPSKLGIEAGASISVADAVKALITKSANDIAVAIAEHIGGDEASFARLMTQKARELGMRSTTFRNAHGLPDSGQVTTARDIILLGMRLYDHFPRHAQQFALRSFTYAGRSHKNHNTMLASYAGMDGLKTGYTSPSGYNLAASVRRNGRHVVAAVFGGATGSARNARMRVILDRALARASPVRTRQPDARPANDSPVIAKVPAPRLARRGQPAAPMAQAATAEGPPRLAEAERTPAPAAGPPTAETGWRSSVRLAGPVRGVNVAGALAPQASLPLPPPAAALPTSEPARPAVAVATVRAVNIVPIPVPAAPAASARGAAPPAAGGPARPPSTLQAQADRMALGQPSAAAPLPAAPPVQGGANIAIQIGAFATEAEARQQLEAARLTSPEAVGAAAPATPAVNIGGRRFYRARFTGFDAAGAARACTELRRRQIDCHVARVE